MGRQNRTLYLYEVTWPTNLPRAEPTQRRRIARAGRIWWWLGAMWAVVKSFYMGW